MTRRGLGGAPDHGGRGLGLAPRRGGVADDVHQRIPALGRELDGVALADAASGLPEHDA